MGLRKGQKELIEKYNGGYCAIPAIPGGGKTFSLTKWASKVIIEGSVENSKILIVTYMNSAVNNFKQRISKELIDGGYKGKKAYFVSTIHGLCLQIIKEKPDIIFASEEFQVIDEVDKNRTISAAIDEWKRENEDVFKYFIETEGKSVKSLGDSYKKWQYTLSGVVKSAISDFKTHGISVDEAIKVTEDLSSESLIKLCSQVYNIFDRKIKIMGMFDFDDMLFNAKKILLTDENILKKYQEKYAFVCEDEAQDSNYIQNEILKLIAKDNFLRVGDSNQAICGSFSNSDVSIFKEFSNDKKTTVYSITQSSRNTREIINLANYFLKYVIEEHPQQECKSALIEQIIEAVDPSDKFPNPVTKDYGIRCNIYESQDKEHEEVLKRILYMKEKFPDKTIAVLFPTAKLIDIFTENMDKKNIEYERLDNTSPERNKILRLLGTFLDFISTPFKEDKFIEMMYECFVENQNIHEFINVDEIQQKELKRLKGVFKNWATDKKIENIIYPLNGTIPYGEIPNEFRENNLWDLIAEYIELVRQVLEFPQNIPQKLILFISEKLRFTREQRAVAYKIASDVEFLMTQKKNWRIKDLAVELLSPKNVFNHFTGVVWELKGYQPSSEKVTVCTYHKSKGLEWDIVFLCGMTNAEFPVTMNDKFKGEYYYLKKDYKNPQVLVKNEFKKYFQHIKIDDAVLESKVETISERTRLLYVGITRAREFLFLSSPYLNKGSRNETKPSEYIEKLKEFITKEQEKWKET